MLEFCAVVSVVQTAPLPAPEAGYGILTAISLSQESFVFHNLHEDSSQGRNPLIGTPPRII